MVTIEKHPVLYGDIIRMTFRDGSRYTIKLYGDEIMTRFENKNEQY